MNNCNNCKFKIYDGSTGTRDCLREDEMTEEQAERFCADMTEGCPFWESDYDPAEEAYYESLLEEQRREQRYYDNLLAEQRRDNQS